MTTNPSIEALLELQVIDKRRQALKQARDQRRTKLVEAQRIHAAAAEAVAAADTQLEQFAALTRQYTADVQRCDTQITELRNRQMGAKTNKEYMAIINGIEQARLEKTHREQSLRELDEKAQALRAKADKARADAEKLRLHLVEVEKAAEAAAKPGPEEQALQSKYDDIKSRVDPKFLETYERLVAARHPMPLMRVDEPTRSTPYGERISMNQLEQIKMGKLVIATGVNSILYI